MLCLDGVSGITESKNRHPLGDPEGSLACRGHRLAVSKTSRRIVGVARVPGLPYISRYREVKTPNGGVPERGKHPPLNHTRSCIVYSALSMSSAFGFFWSSPRAGSRWT